MYILQLTCIPQLLEERFGCGNGIDVNYTAFTQAIDTEFTGQTVEQNRAPGRYDYRGEGGGAFEINDS